MRARLVSTAILLTIGSLSLLAAPAAAGPSCGTADERINLVDAWIWYGGGGCYGAVVSWFPPELCPSDMFGVDRPYAQAEANACAAVVLLQP